MTILFKWLFGTRLGRVLALTTAASAAFLMAWARAWRAGRDAERSKHDQASLDAWHERSKVDDEISKMDEHNIRDELARWVQSRSGKS